MVQRVLDCLVGILQVHYIIYIESWIFAYFIPSVLLFTLV